MFAPLVIAASYHQLHLFDDDACPPYPEEISDVDLSNRLKSTPNMLSIYTASEDDVRLQIEMAAGPVPLEESQWQHIAVASLQLKSGRLVVASPESHLPDCVRFSLPAGSYQVQVAGRGFEAAEREEYLVTLWPGPDRVVSVAKWAGPYAA